MVAASAEQLLCDRTKAVAPRTKQAQSNDMGGQNSQVSASNRRGRGTPFEKGVSGNPGGRPKAALHAQQLARAHTAEAVATLAKALDDPRHRVAAAQALLDRGWGRPLQMPAADPERPLMIDFQWSDAASAHTDVRSIGEQIEAEIIEAALGDADPDEHGRQ
jgi:hypothetical protein